MSSKLKVNATSEQIEAHLHRKIDEMSEGQKKGDYVTAENCRLAIEQLKKDYQVRKLFELDEKQKGQSEDIRRTHEDELQKLNASWDKKINDHEADGKKAEAQLKKKHEAETNQTRENLEKQLPTKIKESSELLNLRKMEAHMSKQKNFVEAHKVQEKCFELEKQQTEVWMNMRDNKIQSSITKLMEKQQHEMKVLQKKIKTGLNELTKERKREEERLRLKYANFFKELKMQHDKEVLSFRGRFRSKGGNSSPQKSRTFIR